MSVRALYRPFGAFRFLLAVLVVSQHFLANVAPLSLAAAARPYSLGANAVLAFFALSGFVIFDAAGTIYAGKPANFLFNRLLRLAPHLLAAVAITIVLTIAFDAAGVLHEARDAAAPGANAYTARNIVFNLLGFLPLVDRFIDYNFLPIGWALRVEFEFYLFVAAALAMTRAFGRAFFAANFERASVTLLAPVAVLFALAMWGRAPAMFQFAPYFAFGCALKASERRPLPAAIVTVAATAGILWQFFADHTRGHAPFDAADGVQLILLLSLLIVFILLAGLRLPAAANLDRALGDLTFPLYLSHSYVSLIFSSLTSCDSLTILTLAVVEALLVAWASRGLIDPAVDGLRDRIRGAPLRERVTVAPPTHAAPIAR